VLKGTVLSFKKILQQSSYPSKSHW